MVWCRIIGTWYPSDLVQAAHIVPFFLDSDTDSIDELLLSSGARNEDGRGAGWKRRWCSVERNDPYLLFSTPISSWHLFVSRTPNGGRLAIRLGEILQATAVSHTRGVHAHEHVTRHNDPSWNRRHAHII
ncbi:hypothetical protein GGR50DRAFT_208116 [Xylaria sp. CBS 124048]|nr:hypothetical protein GGR50DRAFT_208116 [Xylaria sp. CBS 124048]